ncbi:MAG: anaerobic ribonucleoside-triphosphate reductase, partial [Nitrososphaerales archaeon]
MSFSDTNRSRRIYSVIASPNRLEILRILNTKGPLSYSELKTYAGFKSKKESGKFAYHLRKLVKQMLVSLNRAERKYQVTNLGRLILNLTRQIEEQSLLEGGKIYVRSSKQSMEEFTSDRILRSLVREAGMPLDEAQKVTNEAEARLQKFQTAYLTGPLIRELVNSILIEHGYEEYRHKLTRLGMPVSDVTELFSSVSGASLGVDSLLSSTSEAVFSEYLILTQLPRDVSDAHIGGDIHISNTGSWGLKPDILFADLNALLSDGISLGGKITSVPRIPPPKTPDEGLSAFVAISNLLSREANDEICFFNFVDFIDKLAPDLSAKAIENLGRSLFLESAITPNGTGKPFLSLFLSSENLNARRSQVILQGLLNAYQYYVDLTPSPAFKLILGLEREEYSKEVISSIASLVNSGASIVVTSRDKFGRAFSGLKRQGTRATLAHGIALLSGLSVNLPRLAYESGTDDTYFKAKLALVLQLALSALNTRKKALEESVKRGLLPTLAANSSIVSTNSMPMVINLVGLEESLANLVGEKSAERTRLDLAEKVLSTAIKVASEKPGSSNEKAQIAIIQDEGSGRLASLDIEKYGRSLVTMRGEERY